MKHVCSICGSSFERRGNREYKYCSHSCYNLDREKKTKACLLCGKEFMPDRAATKYCSNNCKASARRERKTVTCLECGKEFLQKYLKTNKFCCEACMRVFNNKRVIYSNCTLCGKQFIVSSCKQKYCSQKCFFKSVRKIPTNLEKELYDYLDGISIIYEKQAHINRHIIPDAYIPEFNLCVYADGKYWHDKTKDRDARINDCIIAKGLNYIRLPEIKTHLDLEPLKQFIEHNYIL